MNPETIPTAARALRHIYETHGFCDRLAGELQNLFYTLHEARPREEEDGLYRVIGSEGLHAIYQANFHGFLASLLTTDNLYKIQEERPVIM